MFSFIEVGIFAGIYILFDAPVPNWMNLNSLWLLPNVVLIFVFSVGRGFISKLFSSKYLCYFGGISMECYLVHELVMRYFTLVGTASNRFSACISWLLILSITLCISIAIHHNGLSLKRIGKKSQGFAPAP